MSYLPQGCAQLTMSTRTPFRPSHVVLQANRYRSKTVRGKAAPVVREMAVQVYGRMVDDSKDRSTTFESLTTGEV